MGEGGQQMISDLKSMRSKGMRTTSNLWASLETHPFPNLHDLVTQDRDLFVLLDAYLRSCIEEWFARPGQLCARSIVLLDDCTRTITKYFKLLDGEGQYYFGQFKKLARRILRGVDVDQAKQELATNLDWETFLSEVGDTFIASNQYTPPYSCLPHQQQLY